MTVNLVFSAQFIETKVGKTGLVVTVDIWRITRATLAASEIVTAAAVTEIGDGLYAYLLTGADPTIYDYLSTFKTATATVDQQHLAAAWTNFAPVVWDELLTGALHNIPTSAGRRLRQVSASIIIDGTAIGGTINTIVLDASASAVNGAYDPALIYIENGAGAGQSRLILEYDGATKTAVVDRDWKVIPNGTSDYVIAGNPGREHVNEGLLVAGGIDSAQLNALASADDDAYTGQGIFLRAGTGADQYRRISSYDGLTQTVFVSRDWGTIPDGTTSYVILPTGAISDECLANAIWDSVAASHTIVGSMGEIMNNVNVISFPAGAIEYTYTVNDGVNPVQGVTVWFSTDIAGTNIIWRGETDAFGVARDVLNRKPFLDAGTYYVWVQKESYSGSNPDTEIVS